MPNPRGDPGGGEGGEPARERLEALAGIETWKARLSASVPANPVRSAEGWERRFVAEEERAREMAALYRELGFEVLLDPVDPAEMLGECRGCALVAALRFRTVYTRRGTRG